MGSCGHPHCSCPIQCRRREGEWTYLWASCATISACQRERGFSCSQGAFLSWRRVSLYLAWIGYYDPHATCPTRRTYKATHPKDGTSSCNPPILTSRSSMGCPSEYQSPPSKKVRYPTKWDAGILLQIQWPSLCQGWETRYHDPSGRREQRWRAP